MLENSNSSEKPVLIKKILESQSILKKGQQTSKPPKPERNCEACGANIEFYWMDVPAILKRAGFKEPCWIGKPCRCREEVIIEDKANALFRNTNLKKKFLRATFDNYKSGSSEQDVVLQKLKKYAKNFKTMRAQGTNLLLVGERGTGKTHLAAAIAKSVAKQGFTVEYVKAGSLFMKLKETWGHDSSERASDIIRRLISYDLLIIDELGAQYDSKTEQEFLYQIIDGRYEEEKPTIATSMRSLEDLTKTLGAHVLDRLLDKNTNSLIFEFTWESYR